MPSTRLASVLAALVPLADALTISTATLARPGVSSELSWAAALVNRDVMSDDAAAMPPLPRMELADMQVLDMELYDRECTMLEEWEQKLLAGDEVLSFSDDDDVLHYEDESLIASAFIRG